ncbi:hypothetical protein TNCV_1882271 [Trichonephila clavipes]|nr:hypothetical protein TNCV_1882271 [Trichonephila clavipes]
MRLFVGNLFRPPRPHALFGKAETLKSGSARAASPFPASDHHRPGKGRNFSCGHAVCVGRVLVICQFSDNRRFTGFSLTSL